MLAVIAVGRGFIASSLRTRRWQLWVSLHHNKDSAAPVPGRVCPRIVANFDAFRFANPVVWQIPCRSGHTASIDRLNCGQIGANSSEICGFLAQPFSRVPDLPRHARHPVLNARFPVLLPRSPAAGTTVGSRLRNATFSAWYAFLFVARTRRALMPVPKPIYGRAWQRALGAAAVIFRPPHAITRPWPRAARGASVTPPEGQCTPVRT